MINVGKVTRVVSSCADFQMKSQLHFHHPQRFNSVKALKALCHAALIKIICKAQSFCINFISSGSCRANRLKILT